MGDFSRDSSLKKENSRCVLFWSERGFEEQPPRGCRSNLDEGQPFPTLGFVRMGIKVNEKECDILVKDRHETVLGMPSLQGLELR